MVAPGFFLLLSLGCGAEDHQNQTGDGAAIIQCSDDSECGGAYCVEGFCCDKPCVASCMSCVVKGKEGICSAVPAGEDPNNLYCGPNFACDGAGSCKLATGQKCGSADMCSTGHCESKVCCASSCANGSCSTGRCLLNNGQPCTSKGDCLSNRCEGGKAQKHCCPTSCSSGFCSTGNCCTFHSAKKCYGGDVYWYDSCGNREELYDKCGSDQTCQSAVCMTCTLTCSATSSSVSVGLSCGSSTRTCNYSYNSMGKVSSISCTYSNGTSFYCSIYYSSSGSPHGSCTSPYAAKCTF